MKGGRREGEEVEFERGFYRGEIMQGDLMEERGKK